MRTVLFTDKAFKEFNEWFDADIHITERMKTLIKDIEREPF